MILGRVSSPVMPGIISSKIIRSVGASAAMSNRVVAVVAGVDFVAFLFEEQDVGLQEFDSSSTQSILTIRLSDFSSQN